MSTILVVDDIETNALVLQAMIRLCGYESNIALNGSDAIRQSEEECPDLVFMDLSMPGINGIDTAIAIRSKYPGASVPIFAVTAHDTPFHRNACAEAGFDGFITKPVDLKEIERVLMQRLSATDRRRKPAEHRWPSLGTARRAVLCEFMRAGFSPLGWARRAPWRVCSPQS